MIVYLKTDEEIEGFKKVGLLANKILKKLISEIKPGISTLYLDIIAKRECDTLKVNPIFLGYDKYPNTICASVNDVLVHGAPNNEELIEGDIVSIDMGTELDGYIGDTACTVIVGETQDIVKNKLIENCKLSLYNAIKKAKDGNKLSDISNQISNIAKINGYSIPVEYGGHGIDKYKLHSTPFVPNIPDYMDDIFLRYGMVLAIEPMFILSKSNKIKIASDGWGIVAEGPSAHFEHTVLVGKNEGIILT